MRVRSREDRALVEALRDQVTYLREQLDIRTVEPREHRRLLAGLIERVPELGAPVEPPGPSQSREEAVQEPEGAAPKESAPLPDSAEAKNGSQRPWWRRLFG